MLPSSLFCPRVVFRPRMRASTKAHDSVADNNMWYNAFQDITFPTRFSPLSKEQGKAYISHYRHRYCRSASPSSEDTKEFLGIQNILGDLIRSVGCDGAFVRLNTRSPKDAIALDADEFRKHTQAKSIDEKMNLFFDTSMDTLRVRSGIEAVDLLLSSERIFADILQGSG
jgi:hypothetical protein